MPIPTKISLFCFMAIGHFGDRGVISSPKQDKSVNYKNVGDHISYDEFERIKLFILSHGDRKTFRNFDNNNPHFQFDHFDVYLGADIGQRNINNDPRASDFNQLTIVNHNADIQYYELVIVRKGDLKADKYWIQEGMEEGSVYLVDRDEIGLPNLERELADYLKIIDQRE